MIRLKSEKDIQVLRRSGVILAATLRSLKNKAQIGVSLEELDSLARDLIKKAGAKPAFLDYKSHGAKKGYHSAICASVNDIVVHGLPSKYLLKSGDVLKIDLGVNFNGYFTDAALTSGIGNISHEAQKLIDVTRGALDRAIQECTVDKHLSDIGWAIESFVKKNGFSIVKGLTGHGVGFELHEDPTVYNFGKRGEGIVLESGLVLAIEPMVAIGSGDARQLPDDSFVTQDESLSAHFEHTVVITKNGPEILTNLI